MMSNKDKRKHNKFSKMLAFNNLLEKKGSDLEIEPPDKKLKFTGKSCVSNPYIGGVCRDWSYWF